MLETSKKKYRDYNGNYGISSKADRFKGHCKYES